MIHSVPAAPVSTPCWTVLRRPDPRLRRHVLSYSGFATATPIPHRILPINAPALVIDLTGACRVATGPLRSATAGGDTRWGRGVTVGLTPAAMSALLGGVPLPEITGRTVPLADLLGPAEAALAEQLAAAGSWAGRFALLDRWMIGRLPPHDTGDPLVTAAWWRLQRGPGRTRIATVAAGLGVPRRRLEISFQRALGLSPGAVARTARFQRAAFRILTGVPLSRVAAESGYADQPHLTRDVHSLTGLTPAALRALVPAPAHSFKTRSAAPA